MVLFPLYLFIHFKYGSLCISILNKTLLIDLMADVSPTVTLCVCRVRAPLWAATRFRRVRWSLILVLPRCLWSERGEQPVSLIRPPEEVRKGALLAALGLPSYFLTRRHAPLHGRVLRSRPGPSESAAGGQVADQERRAAASRPCR